MKIYVDCRTIKSKPQEQMNLYKRYSKIDQHLALHFMYNGVCLSSPPPFLCSQIITHFSNSMISTNCGIRIAISLV